MAKFLLVNLLKIKELIRYIALFLCVQVVIIPVNAQLTGINLVPDSSFENTPDISLMNTCNGIPDTFNSRSNVWINPTDGTPDVFSKHYIKDGILKLPHVVKLNKAYCNGNLIYGNSAFDFVLNAKSGSNCIVTSYSPSFFNTVLSFPYYEYVQTPLKLLAGHKYAVGASIFFLPISGFEYPSLDFKFSKEIVSNVYGINEYRKPRYTRFKEDLVPSLFFSRNNFSKSDSTGWFRLQSNFRADSTYNYLTLGYFGADSIKRSLFDTSRKDFAIIAIDDVFVYELPGIIAPNSLCEEEEIEIRSTLSGVHTWYVNGVQLATTDSFFKWKASNTSTIVAKGRFGSDTLTITVHPKPVLQPVADIAFCESSSKDIIPNVNFIGTYTLNGVQKSTPFKIEKEGEYNVVFTSNLGCKDTTDFKATVYDLPPLLPNTLEWCKFFSPEDSILLDSQFQYVFDSITSQNYYHFTQYGPIHYQITDKNACRVKSTLFIENNCEGKIYIPTAFRPSGVNKTFAPFIGIEGNHKLTIYNTWGEKLHESIGLKPSWDGVCKQENLCIGGWYLYTLKLSTGQELSGSVFLIDDVEQN